MRVSVLAARTVLCIVVVAESTNFDRLTNLFRNRREPLKFVRNEKTVVLQLNMLVSWHGYGKLFVCSERREPGCSKIMERNEREIYNYFA